jgi:hypothetical protein
MKDEQKRIHLTITAANNGGRQLPRNKKYRNMEKEIRNLKNEYNTGQRDITSYWRAIAHVTHEFQ